MTARKKPQAKAVEQNEEPAAVWVPRDALHAWEGNPRQNSAAVQKVVESIRKFGFGAPILARRENGEVIAGHTRLEAAALLGLEKVPVRYLDLSEKEAHLLALADNKLNEVAVWDEAALAEILATIPTADAMIVGFTPAEVDDLLSAASVEPEVELGATTEKGTTDAFEEWKGMPDYSSTDLKAKRQILMSFHDDAAVDEFLQRIGSTRKITKKTFSLWYPEEARLADPDREVGMFTNVVYVDEDDVADEDGETDEARK